MLWIENQKISLLMNENYHLIFESRVKLQATTYNYFG